MTCDVFTRLPIGRHHIYTGQPVKKCAVSLQAVTRLARSDPHAPPPPSAVSGAGHAYEHRLVVSAASPATIRLKPSAVAAGDDGGAPPDEERADAAESKEELHGVYDGGS